MEAREAHNLEVDGSNPFSVNCGAGWRKPENKARWRRGTRVGLITRRSVVRSHFSLTVGRQNLWGGQINLLTAIPNHPFIYGEVGGSRPPGATNILYGPVAQRKSA